MSATAEPRLPGRPARARRVAASRWRALALLGLVALVALLHWGGLARLAGGGLAPSAAPPTNPALRVRLLAEPTAPVALAQGARAAAADGKAADAQAAPAPADPQALALSMLPPAPAPATQPALTTVPRKRSVSGLAPGAEAPALASAEAKPGNERAHLAHQADAEQVMSPSGGARPSAAPAATATPTALARGVDLPTFATQLPPSGRLTFELRRAAQSGSAELRWSREGDRYEAEFRGRLAGTAGFDWHSQGAIDAAGISPERFVVRRRAREVQAANFQRAAGKISFSGPAVEYPLPAGAQDRLTWMLQLAGIAAAATPALEAGTQIPIFVADARGDADVWWFTVVGAENLHTGNGSTATLKLVREARGPYDARIEVWLDPARHSLPLMLRHEVAGGAALEMRLQVD